MLAISAALPAGVSAQAPAQIPSSGPSSRSDAELAAGDEFREAARSLNSVKLPRSAEPATRFEA